MKTLTIPLKKKYFDAIKSGEKKFEYRLMIPFWRRRLENRHYTKIVLTCGYPKRNDKTRRITRLWRGYKRVIIQHDEFGPNEVEVFAIRVN